MTTDSLSLADQLSRMLQALERIERYTHDLTRATFLDNELVQDAVIHNLESLADASEALAPYLLPGEAGDGPLAGVLAVCQRLGVVDLRSDPRMAWNLCDQHLNGAAGRLRELLEASVSVESFCEALPRRATGAVAGPLAPLVHGWSAERVRSHQREAAANLGLEVAFRDTLSGGTGPEMLVIPPGRFLMGSPDDEGGRFDNEDQHQVNIPRPFAMARCALSFAEYDAFCGASGRACPSDWGWGRGRSPVVSVSWDDALSYCAWLSAETGQGYRLATEAEWEYACRAGTTTAFWWGAEIHPVLANFGGEHRRTLPVDTLQPNPWGLFHVHGNVWEWTGSDWQEYYHGQESVLSQGHGEQRVIRGGAWNNRPRHCRAAYRNREKPWTRVNYLGFRVVRDL